MAEDRVGGLGSRPSRKPSGSEKRRSSRMAEPSQTTTFYLGSMRCPGGHTQWSPYAAWRAARGSSIAGATPRVEPVCEGLEVGRFNLPKVVGHRAILLMAPLLVKNGAGGVAQLAEAGRLNRPQ